MLRDIEQVRCVDREQEGPQKGSLQTYAVQIELLRLGDTDSYKHTLGNGIIQDRDIVFWFANPIREF